MEIDGGYPRFVALREQGEALMAVRSFSPSLRQVVSHLDQTWYDLYVIWEERKQLLQQCSDLQVNKIYVI